MEIITTSDVLATRDAIKRINDAITDIYTDCYHECIGVFETFGIECLRLVEPWIQYGWFGRETYQCKLTYDRTDQSFTFYTWEQDENEDSIDSAKVDLDDFTYLYHNIITTVNQYIERGLPKQYWGVGYQDGIEKISYSQASLDYKCGYATLVEEIKKQSKAFPDAEDVIKGIMLSNGIEELKIPAEFMPEITDAPKSGAKRFNYFIKLDSSDNELRYCMAGAYYSWRNPYNNWDLAVAMCQAIDFYREKGMPKFEWSGEDEYTRALEAETEYEHKEDTLITPNEGIFMDTNCYSSTMVSPEVSSGNRLRLKLYEHVYFPQLNGWEQVTSFNTNSCTADYVVKSHFCFTISISGIQGYAELMRHYGIPVADRQQMIDNLVMAMHADAEKNGYKSVIDFCKLFESLGIFVEFNNNDESDI